jgi:serine/threonine protein kinase
VSVPEPPQCGSRTRISEPATRSATDDRQLGRFRLIEKISAGGAGQVYRAEDLVLRRTVALKMLPAPQGSAGGLGDALLQEARAAAAFHHPNLATTYELALDAEPPFVVMELLDGETLSRKIEAGPLTVAAAVDVACQMADGLAEVHRRGWIHGDLSADNVVLTAEGRVKILDFGLARSSVTRPASAAHLQPETVAAIAPSGTLGYLAPECLEGRPSDARCDVFALGVILFEMLTGRPPFPSTEQGGVKSALRSEPLLIGQLRPDVPLELERITRRCLSKRPESRYPSAEAMLSELRAVASALDASAPRQRTGAAAARERTEAPSADPRPQAWWRKRLWPVSVLFHRAFARRPRGSSPLAPSVAFRGLLPFQEADRDRFFGRGFDVSLLLERAKDPALRFLVLYGDSGTGKTSLLRAGLIPRLWEEGLFPLYVRPFGDPITALLRECEKRGYPRRWPDEPLTDLLARMARSESTDIVLAFDQFEEYFIRSRSARHGDRDGGPGRARQPVARSPLCPSRGPGAPRRGRDGRCVPSRRPGGRFRPLGRSAQDSTQAPTRPAVRAVWARGCDRHHLTPRWRSAILCPVACTAQEV